MFEIEEHVHVQKGKALRERQRQKLQGKKGGAVFDKARFLRRHEGMGCRAQVAGLKAGWVVMYSSSQGRDSSLHVVE